MTELSGRESRLYAWIAEKEGMQVDEWLQSLPHRYRLRLKAEQPDLYRDVMTQFAEAVLDDLELVGPTAEESCLKTCISCRRAKPMDRYRSLAAVSCIDCLRGAGVAVDGCSRCGVAADRCDCTEHPDPAEA